MAVGEQAGPERSDEPADEFRKMRLRSRVRVCTARATEDVGTSETTSTCCVSSHWRTMLDPMSGLFWWSAATTSMGLPSTVPPKSSTAMRAATTDPGPVLSDWPALISESTPILTTSSEIWACAAADPSATARRAQRRDSSFIAWPPRLRKPCSPGQDVCQAAYRLARPLEPGSETNVERKPDRNGRGGRAWGGRQPSPPQ